MGLLNFSLHRPGGLQRAKESHLGRSRNVQISADRELDIPGERGEKFPHCLHQQSACGVCFQRRAP
jgi:hypothetical protein